MNHMALPNPWCIVFAAILLSEWYLECVRLYKQCEYSGLYRIIDRMIFIHHMPISTTIDSTKIEIK